MRRRVCFTDNHIRQTRSTARFVRGYTSSIAVPNDPRLPILLHCVGLGADPCPPRPAAPVRPVPVDVARAVLPARDLPSQYPPDRAAAPSRDVRRAGIPEAACVLFARNAQRRLPGVQPGSGRAREGGAIQPPREFDDRLQDYGQDHGRGQHADGVPERAGVLEGGASLSFCSFYPVASIGLDGGFGFVVLLEGDSAAPLVRVDISGGG